MYGRVLMSEHEFLLQAEEPVLLIFDLRNSPKKKLF